MNIFNRLIGREVEKTPLSPPTDFSLDTEALASAEVWLRKFLEATLRMVIVGGVSPSEQFFDAVAYPKLFLLESYPERSFADIIKLPRHNQVDWLSQIRLELLRLIWGENTDFRHPAGFWRLLAIKAWSDLKFDYSIRTQTEKWMSTHWYYAAGELPQPVFHINSYWILLAAVPYEAPKGNFHPETQLSKVAEETIGKGWGTYWDLWLVCRARQVWGTKARWSATLSPKINRLEEILQNKNWDASHEFLRAGWGVDVPLWFESTLEKTRSDIVIARIEA